MFIKVKKENSHYYNTLLSNTGFSMLEGWENNYSDLDIPKIWKNASFTQHLQYGLIQMILTNCWIL